MFSHPDAFKHQYKDIFESNVESIDEHEDRFAKTPDEIKKQVHSFLNTLSSAEETQIKRPEYRRFHDSPIPKPEHTLEVETGGFNEELTRFNGEIIYCFFNKKE